MKQNAYIIYSGLTKWHMMMSQVNKMAHDEMQVDKMNCHQNDKLAKWLNIKMTPKGQAD